MTGFLTLSTPYEISPDTVSRRLGDTAVLIRLTTNRIYELNATGARLWDLLQTQQTLDEVVESLSAEFEGPREAIRADVEDLLRQLTAEGLVRQS